METATPCLLGNIHFDEVSTLIFGHDLKHPSELFYDDLRRCGAVIGAGRMM